MHYFDFKKRKKNEYLPIPELPSSCFWVEWYFFFIPIYFFILYVNGTRVCATVIWKNEKHAGTTYHELELISMCSVRGFFVCTQECQQLTRFSWILLLSNVLLLKFAWCPLPCLARCPKCDVPRRLVSMRQRIWHIVILIVRYTRWSTFNFWFRSFGLLVPENQSIVVWNCEMNCEWIRVRDSCLTQWQRVVIQYEKFSVNKMRSDAKQSIVNFSVPCKYPHFTNNRLGLKGGGGGKQNKNCGLAWRIRLHFNYNSIEWRWWLCAK